MAKDDEKKKGGSFGSFKDLLGQFGGGAEEAAADAGTEPADAAADADEVDAGEPDDFSGAARLLIGGRPTGYGAMAHGPACYRDEDSEEMRLLASFRARTIFPADVLREMSALPRDPDPGDYEKVPWRTDYRRDRIFTIDGEDAKDFDDAISIKATDEGYTVGVHIADVSHYVRPGTALNAEALARATSIYVADQVVPMLPEEISNHLCSLNPDRERLAFSVIMDFDRKGRRTGFHLTKSVIKSMRRCTYKNVQALLDGTDDEHTRRLKDLEPDLRLFAEWTKHMQAQRDRRGSMRMQSGERKFRFDAAGEVTGVYQAANYFSQTLIEETALAANQAVGDFFKANGLPTIYRIHPEKDKEEIEKTVEMLEKYGVRVPKKERLTGRDIGDMIRYARRQKNAEGLTARIMGLVERAAYEVRHHDDTAEHFGLATEHYLHFTSPIRRYPDLMVHRMLFDLLQRGDAARADILSAENLADLTDVASHSSQQADVADMIESAIEDLKICQYMEPKIGHTFHAWIVRVSPPGIDIQLKDEYVTGFLPSKTIGNQVVHEGPVLTIRSARFSKTFREGDPIDVAVQNVDFVRLRVLFELPQASKSR
jgi:ribonuclease R